MQAISCNELVASAKILLKTLKHLEPKASSNISVLMSDDFCYNAFVESVAEVLQLEVLTTIPLQKTFVEKYVRTVQCALAPYNERLDEIVFAFHRMMHHINRKVERIEKGNKLLQNFNVVEIVKIVYLVLPELEYKLFH